ncbi:tudor domain-containing protein 1 [Melanotaenia boesemani]|uniref:tudor domain-containing protein 1 n=1 Tax=Melanotaenia boesemani TaxID=1250792 RepID=UPI001C055379|nr:tudor domain-containing protein 1 [Melanotaenia boesemani]
MSPTSSPTVTDVKMVFSPSTTQPIRPLRKPSSGPMAPSLALPSKFATVPSSRSAPAAPGATVDGPITTPVVRNKTLMGLVPPALTVYFCNYCGQQGNFRCKRCKKMPYCSVVCQAEDWKAHRHACKPVEPEPAAQDVSQTIGSPVIGNKDPLAEMKDSDSSSPRKVYMNDLCMSKTIMGTDIQASVVEFYSPSRFFLLPQNPELLETLQMISTQLQKTSCVPSVTPYVPCVGEVCAVQFSCDMNWYRGFVQTVAADQQMANILYIDFGNEENVPVDRIRPLPANIHPFSPCIMECRIADMVPVVGNWSGECCIAVRQLLAGKTVTVKLVAMQENSHVHLVDILLSVGGKYLSTFLLEQEYAVKETANLAPTEKDISAMMNASLKNFRCLSDGKDDNTWAQPPEPITQAVGDQLSVLVTHFQSPNQFIVQKVENAGVIQDLQVKLREHCSKVAAPQNFRPAPGTVCCAQFSEDKLWYRAEVLAYPSEKRVCVGYLDFGNSEEVDLSHLRPISASLLALPMQAIPCGLAGVQPVGDGWSEDCLLALQRRVSNRILRIDIQGAYESKALVTMIDEASDPQANIGELLISAGYAAPTPATTSVDQQTVEGGPTGEPHVSLPECAPLVWSTTELPRDGQRVALLVSNMESPGKFHCCINNPTDHQRLMELGAQLKEHCEADTSPFIPKVGEPCCAMFPGGCSWYRVMVKELSDDGATVNFVDYGYNTTVEKSKLHSITPKLLKLPFQAVPCWLTGVEPLGSEWSSEALLWFQTLVDGEPLSALVLSVTEQGYGVELESRGQKVAAALISEQLAKVPGEASNETCAKSGSVTKQQKGVKENGHDQLLVEAPNKMEVSSEETISEGQTAVPSDVTSFPVDWKTVELPLNKTFQPCIAAVISPSLFYLFGVTQVDQQKLQEVMMDLAAYCNNSTSSVGGKCSPAPGAACCAQFSGDNNWYRAVVLRVGENELSVVYADYGNSEMVPFSKVLPIPMHLLQLPFQITRCTLTGIEHFPAEWPTEVQQMFGTEVVNGVLATVKAFDGSANVLSLTLPAERGGGHLTTMILDALNVHSNPDTMTRTDKPDDMLISSAAEPGLPQPKPIPEFQNDLETMTVTVNTMGPNKTAEPTTQRPQQTISTSAATANEDPVKVVDQMEPPCQDNTNDNDPQTSSCCCQSLKTKIDNVEQMMQLQLELIKKLVGENK